ncbi:MAG: hemin uptake protein HemP [Rhodocyclaceae bacterium]|nr:MAG: hemin uptake protein HemP [Rhodocyclaceae bacterium]
MILILYYLCHATIVKSDTLSRSVPPTETLRVASPPVFAKSIESTTLLGARGEVEISHSGETYRLRRTRQDKLILTK